MCEETFFEILKWTFEWPSRQGKVMKSYFRSCFLRLQQNCRWWQNNLQNNRILKSQKFSINRHKVTASEFITKGRSRSVIKLPLPLDKFVTLSLIRSGFSAWMNPFHTEISFQRGIFHQTFSASLPTPQKVVSLDQNQIYWTLVI